jgi:hypothetical protein
MADEAWIFPFSGFQTLEKGNFQFYVAKQLIYRLPFRVLRNISIETDLKLQTNKKTKNHEPATQKTFFCTPEGINIPFPAIERNLFVFNFI